MRADVITDARGGGGAERNGRAVPLSVPYSPLVPASLESILQCVRNVSAFGRDLPDVAALVARAFDGLLVSLARLADDHAANAPVRHTPPSSAPLN